jgi:hypothetical protein
MMKKVKKIRLNRETLRGLDNRSLIGAGGYQAVQTGQETANPTACAANSPCIDLDTRTCPP